MTLSARRPAALDEDAFERFVHQAATRLLRTAYLLTGDRAHAEDLLQLALLRTARRWPAAARAPEPYARQVLVNLARDRHRQATRRLSEAPLEEAAIAAVGSDLSEAAIGRGTIMAALAVLPARQREVLVLRFYADLSVAETAAAMGVAEGTVKAHTSRALARMRDLLGEQDTTGRPAEVRDVH